MSKRNQIRKEIFHERNGKCERCGCELYFKPQIKKEKNGKKKAHFHHKIFRSDNGPDIKENLTLTCWECEKKFHRKYNIQNRPRIKRRNQNE